MLRDSSGNVIPVVVLCFDDLYDSFEALEDWYDILFRYRQFSLWAGPADISTPWPRYWLR